MIFAYLDPATGSLLLQALLGGFAGIAVAYKAWRARIAGKAAAAAAKDGETESVDESALTSES